MASPNGVARLSTKLGGILPRPILTPALGDNLNPEFFPQVAGSPNSPPSPTEDPTYSHLVRKPGYFLKTENPAVGSMTLDISALVDGDYIDLPDWRGGRHLFEFKVTPGYVPNPAMMTMDLSGPGGLGAAFGVLINTAFGRGYTDLHIGNVAVTQPNIITIEFCNHMTGSSGNLQCISHVASPTFILTGLTGGGTIATGIYVNLDGAFSWVNITRLLDVLTDLYADTSSVGHTFLPAPDELTNNDYIAVPGCGSSAPGSPRTWNFEFHVTDPFVLSPGAIEVDIRGCLTKEDVRDTFMSVVQARSCLIQDNNEDQILTSSTTWRYPINGNWTRCAFSCYQAIPGNLAVDGLSGGTDSLSLCLDQFGDIRTLLELLPNLLVIGEDAHTASLDWCHHHIVALQSLQGNLSTLSAVAAAWDAGGRFLPPP